jgi:pimeloyl-ACP methyl ester carboxylesterase
MKSKYRLILPDTQGHGASDKPRDPQAYTPAHFDITSVLDDVGVSKAVYWGYSQGGWIGFALAQHALSSNFGLRDGAALRRAPPPPTG